MSPRDEAMIRAAMRIGWWKCEAFHNPNAAGLPAKLAHAYVDLERACRMPVSAWPSAGGDGTAKVHMVVDDMDPGRGLG